MCLDGSFESNLLRLVGLDSSGKGGVISGAPGRDLTQKNLQPAHSDKHVPAKGVGRRKLRIVAAHPDGDGQTRNDPGQKLPAKLHFNVEGRAELNGVGRALGRKFGQAQLWERNRHAHGRLR